MQFFRPKLTVLRATLLFALFAPLPTRGEEPAKQASRASKELRHHEFFEAKIRPILIKRCQSCHGPEKQEFGLRMDSRAHLLAGSDAGPVVAAGAPANSKLIDAIGYEGDIQMPPEGKLPEEEIVALRRWVELGLPWPEDENARSAAPMTADDRHRHARENLWSLQPIEPPALPHVENAGWPRSPIDRYVLAKLEAAELSPSPQADRRTLIRRAKFDLLGLPPTPAEVQAFEQDSSPDAYARLIDRLLASPAYGERWGRHWLDVARYADTRGYAFGREKRFPYAYTYRDWVIKSLNADMPYDEFIVQQIAADCLPENPPHQQAALGFLTVGRKFNNAHDNIDDQIDVVTRGFLGLTVACARCHDHKYDAIPTEDYYSLYGVFASSTAPDEYPLIGPPAESAAYEKYQAELAKRKKALEDFTSKKQAELQDAARRNVTEYLVRVVTKKPEALLAKLPFISLDPGDLKPRLITAWRQYLQQHAGADHPVFMPLAASRAFPEERFAEQFAELLNAWENLPPERMNPLVRGALVATPPQSKEDLARRLGDLLTQTYDAWKQAGGNDAAREKLSPPQRELLDLLLAEGTPTNIPRDEVLNNLNRADRNHFRKLEKEVDTHMARSPGAPPRAMSLVDKDRPITPQVFIRGNHQRRGDRVPRQFLRVVAGDDRRPFASGSGRLELARAIADPSNPLTARVIVNRVWMHHFGRPLVETPSDFGMRSRPPLHQDVLDYLADRLIGGGWSLKDLHREIMLSATYRQSSNIAGRIANPSHKDVDPENDLLWRMNRRRLEFEPLRDALLHVSGRLDDTMYGRPVDVFTNTDSGRRSVYALIDRQDLPNLLRAFDFASPDQSIARRPHTTVPQQALFLMNSPFVIQQAKAVAARPEIAGETEARARIQALYRLLLTRKPSDEELAAGEQFLAAAEANQSPADKLAPWEQYAQLLLMSNEFMFVD